jgi:hypothetical protein
VRKPRLQRLQRYRRFYLPFIYGLATANFVAVIQLISAPQLNIQWGKLIPPETSELLPLVGFCGMILMTASVPILVGFALYTELALRARHFTRVPFKLLTFAATLGMLGPGFSFFAFHPAFAVAYFASLIATMFVADRAIDRIKKKDSN